METSRDVDWNSALAPERPRWEGAIGNALLYGFRLNWQSILCAGCADTLPILAGGDAGPIRECFPKTSCATRLGEGNRLGRNSASDDGRATKREGAL